MTQFLPFQQVTQKYLVAALISCLACSILPVTAKAGSGLPVSATVINRLSLANETTGSAASLKDDKVNCKHIIDPAFIPPPAPVITSFSPARGSVGTLVTLNGTDLDSPSAFTIGGITALVISNTGTQLTGFVMPGSVTGAISLTTAGGTTTATGNFTVTPTPYPSAQQGSKLVGTGATGLGYQGYSVAVSADGNTAIVSGYHDNSSQGAIWVYTRSGGVWTQQGNKLVGTGNTGVAQLGKAIALSADGNTAIVGAQNDNSNLGAVWVFTRSGGVWAQQGNKLVASDAVGTAFQGYSVAVSADGNTTIVGGFDDNSGQGAAWVYTRSGGIWTQQGNKLVGSGSIGNAFQGNSVAISADGNTAMVGGYYDNLQQGAAWVFTRSGGTWTQQGNKLVGTGNVGAANQAQSVSLSADGNTAIVGGYGDNTQKGAVWVYTRSGGTWTQQGNKLVGTGGSSDSRQGWSISLSADGNTALVGGFSDNGGLGAAWTFTRNAGIWSQSGNKLVGTNSSVNASQGQSVSLSADGSTALVGGYTDNGNQGAAWVFSTPPPSAPVITSFSPASGPVGTTVTITGTNFNTTPTNNIVFFGATMATVTAASTTSLTVTVPAGGTYQPISVLNAATALIGYSASPFVATFTPAKGSITTSDFAANVDFTAGTNPLSVAIGDLDGDGKPDLAVVNIHSNTVSVYRNTSGSGSITAASFAAKVDFTTGSFPYSVAIGDLDGDGKPDMAVVNSLGNTVSVFRNMATSGSITAASFAAKVDFTTGANPYGVAIGDLDGDGKPDLAVANNGSATVSIFRNTSISGSITAASFAAKVDFTTGGSPVTLAIGDLDGDGKPDLAVGNQGNSTLSVFRNTSVSGSITAASFAAKVDFTTGGLPYSVAIGDLDGDGKPELAVVNQGSSNAVSVFRNTATSGSITAASFAAKVDFTTGANPYSVAIGDLDGDGKPDLATANLIGNTVSIFRNTATSGSITAASFAAKVDFATGTNPRSVAIGDLDGDGKPDLATANLGGNTVSVLRNSPVFPSLTITSFSPSSGPVGTLVTINGTNLNSPTAFTIGGATALVISNTGSVLTGLVMPGAVTGAVSVTTTAGTATGGSNFTVTPSVPPAVQQGNKLTGTGLSGSGVQESPVAISADGNTAIVGIWYDNTDQGAALIYTRTGGVWSQQGNKLVGTGNAGQAEQGTSVGLSADGNTAIVGGFFDNAGIGAAWIYTRSGGVWSQQGNKLVGTGGVGTSAQGTSVSLSADGNTAIVGAYNDNSAQGAVWVFTRSGGVWTQQGNKLVGTGGIGQPHLGGAVALSADGNTIIAGGEYDNTGQGATWIFTNSGGTWSQQGSKLIGTGVIGLAAQGFSVAINADGNTALIGGSQDNGNQGAAWVFTRSGNTWTQQGSKIVGTGNVGPANQGFSVALSADGSTAIVGGPEDGNTSPPRSSVNGNAPILYGTNNKNGQTRANFHSNTRGAGSSSSSITGATWVFTRSGGTWNQAGNKLVGTGGIGSVQQGYGVAISADASAALIGGPGDNADVGATWVFIPGATNNANLADLTITGGTITPVFSPSTFSYTANVLNTTSNTTVTPTSSDGGATIKVNGVAVVSGTASGPIALSSGANTINVVVTAQDGTTAQTYTITITRALANQTITFAPLPAKTYGNADFAPGATSDNSTIPVTYTSDNTAVATIVSGNIHIVAAGTANITASQAGDANYNAATSQSQLLTVNQAAVTVTATAQSKVYGTPDPALSYSITSGALSSGDTFTGSLTRVAGENAGSYSINQGTLALSNNYTLTYIGANLTIGQATLTVTADNQSKLFGAANPPLTITYSGFVNGESQANLTSPATAATTATTNSPGGTYPITVSGAASTNYTFNYVNGTLTILTIRTLTFNSLPAKTYGDSDFDPGATVSSGETVIYASSNTAAATIVNGKIHITGAGTTTITASVPVNSNYSNSPTASQVLVINKATQTISFAAIPAQLRGGSYDLSTITATSGLPVSFSSSDPLIANIQGQTLNALRLGTASITASQGGDSNFLPAASVVQIVTVTDAAGDDILVHPVVSPNGDGINDVLYIEGIQNHSNNKVALINRNGVLIYEVTGYNNTSRVFDGHSNITGSLQQQGTYFYLVEYEGKRKTGYFVLRY